MTAKEKLLQRVQTLSEDEAAETLRLLDQRADSLTRLLDNAPADDEPSSPEEDALIVEANADIAAGRTIPLAEILREFG
jgi:hypothetical protein